MGTQSTGYAKHLDWLPLDRWTLSFSARQL